MTPDGPGQPDPLEAMRADLLERLRARSSEVEEALLSRGLEITPEVSAEPEGLAGLRTAVSESIDFIIEAVEEGESWTPSLPPAVAAQVRYLARRELPLESVMETYTAAVGVFIGFLTTEIHQLPADALRYLLGVQSQHSDRVMRAYSLEYTREVERLNRSPAQRLEQRVRKLLRGGVNDTAGIDYDFDSWHLGFVVSGPKAGLEMQGLAEKLGCRLLYVPRRADEASWDWAWMGAGRRIPFEELKTHYPKGPAAVSLAVGEPRSGMVGWRLTHQEAQLARTMMPQVPQEPVRGSDVVLAAAVTRDPTVSKCLIDAYLSPLDGHRDGASLRETLRAYLAVDCNAASTAASLGIDRHTVQRRVRRIEASIGRPLSACRAELEVALRVDQLPGASAAPAPS